MKTKSKRLANIELLRIVAMLMVIMLHYLGKGEVLPEIALQMDGAGYLAWILESLSIVAVNTYVLISGYFLVESEFKPGKLLKLILQVLFYTILVTVLSLAFGIIRVEDLGYYNLIVQIFPFQLEQYWFMTSYLVMFILSPVLALGAKSLTEKQLRMTIIFFVLFMSVEKSILPVQIVFDERGYDALWFICLFLVAAYIRLYGIRFLEKPLHAAVLYVGGCMLALTENIVLSVIYAKTGELGHLIGTPMHYNHIWVLLAALGFFHLFLHVKMKEGWFSKIICKIAPYTLGVYLLHEHVYIKYLWPKWLGAGKATSVGGVLLSAIGAVLIVFFVGIIVDYLRSVFFDVVGKVFGKIGRKKKER